MWCICLEKIIQVLNSLFRTAFHPRVAGEKRKALHEVAVMAAACLRGVFGGKGNRKQSSGLGLPLNLNLAPKNPSRVSDSKPMLRITLRALRERHLTVAHPKVLLSFFGEEFRAGLGDVEVMQVGALLPPRAASPRAKPQELLSNVGVLMPRAGVGPQGWG